MGSSRDPSPPLPFWDKIRLIYHGRLTMIVNELKVKLHASLDPYNTTEEMELNWYNTAMDWTNGIYIFNPFVGKYNKSIYNVYINISFLHHHKKLDSF